MLLATTQVEDFDHFLEIFSTKGAEKRQPACGAAPAGAAPQAWDLTPSRRQDV